MAGKWTTQNYYEILEVSPQAAQHEIHLAYQRAKATYRPDSPALYTMFTEEEARQLLSLIDEAYEVLSNHLKRNAYDRSLMAQAAVPDGTSAVAYDFAKFDRASKEKASTKPTFSTGHVGRLPRPQKAPPNRNITLPEGFRRTRLSIYEVNKEFEDEIHKTEDYDGQFLQRVRLYKNINLDQMCNETRIGRPYLVAVESNDYDALPAAVFVRGFVVQIARVLGLEEHRVASGYMKFFKKGRVE